jgi:acetyltransferase
MVNTMQCADRDDGLGRDPTSTIDVRHPRHGGRLLLRPVLPRDQDLLRRMIGRLSPATRYNRFHGALKELPPEVLHRMTHVEGERHLALVVTSTSDDGEVLVAEGRYAADECGEDAELALVVDDRWQGCGIGALLLRALVEAAGDAGLRRLRGSVLRSNSRMLLLAKRFGFSFSRDSDDARLIRVEISPGVRHRLEPPAPARA